MRLRSHLRAHWRNPVHGLREWWTLGRHANWEDTPAPLKVVVENDLPDAEIRRMWDEGTPVELATPQFRCEHMTISGALVRAPSCGACGPMRRVA